MNGEERVSMEKAIEEALKPLDNLTKSIRAEFNTASGSLATVQTDVAVIKTTQEVQGREIKELRGRVNSLHDKVDMQKDQWTGDIGSAIDSCRTQREQVAEAKEKGEVTGVANLAKERERARREGKPSVAPSHRDSWIAEAFRSGLKPVLQFIVLAAAVGAITVVATRCGDVEKADLKETQHQLELVQKQLKKINGGSE